MLQVQRCLRARLRVCPGVHCLGAVRRGGLRGSRLNPFEVHQAARQLACALLDGNIAEHYARAVQPAVQTSSHADEGLKELYEALPEPLWYDGDELDARRISTSLGAPPQDRHQPLRQQLGWLRDLLLAPRHKAEEMLIRGTGKGSSLAIVLLQYAAAPGPVSTCLQCLLATRT